MVGFEKPFEIAYPLGGITSPFQIAYKFCEENFARFELRRDTSYKACVEPIMEVIKEKTAEYVKVKNNYDNYNCNNF